MLVSQTDALKKWFQQVKRSFPWRENPSPYAVWISEVMLQQTRASVVVSYFKAFMQKFPTVKDLSEASLEDLFKVWEGLGYYSRARNLKQAASDLMEKRGGVLPSSLEELLQMKGVGSYTAGAIASFAFHQRAAAVDGNVSRVICRYFALEGAVKKKELEQKTLDFLPQQEPWVVMEALIELGATLCQKNPICQDCPLRLSCSAFLQGKTKDIPIPKKMAKIEYLLKMVAVIVHDGFVLVEKKKEGKVLAGLMEFPSFSYALEEEIEDLVEKHLGLKAIWQEDLAKESYSYTRYRVELFPCLFKVEQKKEVEGFFWKSLDDLSGLTFSSGHKRVLLQILDDKKVYV